MTGIIISYDGTPNDDDALALGRLMARAGGSLALAYVRHSHEFDARREALAQHDAERLLERGAGWLGDPSIPRYVIVNPSTVDGLAQLAEQERAAVIVFGSDYRTTPGHVEPGTSAQRLLDGGPVAIAIAPAGFRAAPAETITAIAVAAEVADTASAETAASLAAAFGATLVESPAAAGVGLIVLGSSPAAQQGQVALPGSARVLMETASCPVLVVPTGNAVLFGDT